MSNATPPEPPPAEPTGADAPTAASAPTPGRRDVITELAERFWIDLQRRFLHRFAGTRALAGDGHYLVTLPPVAFLAPVAVVVVGFLLGASRATWDVTFTESLPTMIAAVVVGTISGVLGILAVAALALGDLVVGLAGSSEPLSTSSVASLVISYLLLASVVVIVPRTGRALGEAVAKAKRIPAQLAWPITSLLVVLVAWFGTQAWVAMAPTLVRPRFVWNGSDPTVTAIAPLQEHGQAIVAAAIIAAIVRQLWLGATMVEGPIARRLAAAEARSATGRAAQQSPRLPGPYRRGLADLLGAALATAVLAGILETWGIATAAFGVFLVLRLVRSGTLVVPGVGTWKRLAARVPAVVRIILLWLVARVGTDALASNVIESYTGLAVMVMVGAGLVWLLFPGQPRDDGSAPTGRAAAAGGAVAIGLLALVAWPEPALADNCSVFTDCFGQSNAAAEAGFGLMLLTGLSLVLDFIPIIGDVKGVVEGVTGRDLLTGEELAAWERALGMVPIIPIDALKGLRHLDGLGDIGSGARHADGVPAGVRGPRGDVGSGPRAGDTGGGRGADGAHGADGGRPDPHGSGPRGDGGRGPHDPNEPGSAGGSGGRDPGEGGRSGGRGRGDDSGGRSDGSGGRSDDSGRGDGAGRPDPQEVRDRTRQLQESGEPITHSSNRHDRIDDLVNDYNDANLSPQARRNISEELGEIGGVSALEEITGRNIDIMRPTSADEVADLTRLVDQGQAWDHAVTFRGNKVTDIVYWDGDTLHVVEAKGGGTPGGGYGDRMASHPDHTGRIHQTDPEYPLDVAHDMQTARQGDGRQDIGALVETMHRRDDMQYISVRTGPRSAIQDGSPTTVIEHVIKQ